MARVTRLIRLGFVSAFMVGLLGSPSPSAANPRKVYQKALPSVMTLEIENHDGDRFVGTAVSVLDEDLVATAWHVVNDARSVWATFSDGSRIKVVGCVDQDGARDIALLKLERKATGRVAKLNPDLQGVATRAYVIGAPKGFGFSITDGLISQVRTVDGISQYQVSCPISPGNSGGPVLDSRGRVIGIVSWTKSDAQNVSFAVPSRELMALKKTRKVVSWDDLAAAARPPEAPHRLNAARPQPVSSPLSQGIEELVKRLEQSAGKQVTVIVHEDGQESRFTINVPPAR